MIARIRHYVLSALWAVSPECAAVMADVINRRHADVYLSAEEVAARLQAAAPQPRERTTGGGDIAVLPLWGLISHRAHQVEQLSGPGGTSAERFSEAFRSALRDPSVSAIVVDVNSPGGSVDGITELAAEIREARGKKPIVSYVNSTAASAAYWIATAADEVVVTPSGQVGAIGVFAAHEDVSKEQEAAGRKVTLVSAGKYKVDGNPFEPLSDTAHAHLKGRADALYGMFVRDVAKNRGVGVEAVRNGYGEGRTVLAKDALAEGMVDAIETFPQLISRLSRGQTLASRAAAASVGARADSDDVPILAEAVIAEPDGGSVRKSIAAVSAAASELEATLATIKAAAIERDNAEAAADADQRRMRLAIARGRQGAA